MLKEIRNRFIRPLIQQMEQQKEVLDKCEIILNKLDGKSVTLDGLSRDILQQISDIRKENTNKQCNCSSRFQVQMAPPAVETFPPRVISSGDFCISLISNCHNKDFFWVSYKEASDNVSETAHKAEAWFPAELTELCDKPNKYVLDIGANIGGVSLYLASCGWKGIGIEASRDNCQVLRQSIGLNRFDFLLREIGIWDKTGKIYFHQRGPWGYVCTESVDGAEEISVISLDDLQETIQKDIPELDFIKMDIEGSEVAALLSCPDCHTWSLKVQQFPVMYGLVAMETKGRAFFGSLDQ